MRDEGVRLDAFVKLPGLLIVQYLFFWNWKRIVDLNSWRVVLAGFLVWPALAGLFALLIMIE